MDRIWYEISIWVLLKYRIYICVFKNLIFNNNALKTFNLKGTPIQNNLTELWALLKWLEVEPYASHRQLYKQQIENAIKHGHPNGLQRLQTLIQAICLRRTKSDQVRTYSGIHIT